MSVRAWMTDRGMSKIWPSEAEKLYKLAVVFRERAAASRDYHAKIRFLAQASYFDEVAWHAQQSELTPH